VTIKNESLLIDISIGRWWK